MIASARRLATRWLLPAALAATVFLFACGSSSVEQVAVFGQDARWVALAATLVVATWLVIARRASFSYSTLLPAAALVGLALASSAWSGDIRLTAGRALTFAAALALGVLIGSLAAASPEAGVRALAGLLAGATAIAIAGLVVYAVDPSLAMQAGGPGSVARLRGFGLNPNTMPLLFALAAPIGTWFAVTGRGRCGRAGGAAASLLLVGSIVAADSRGALGAAFLGAAVVALLACRGRQLVASALVLALVIGVVTGVVAARRPPTGAAAVASAVAPPPPLGSNLPAGAAHEAALKGLPISPHDPNDLGSPRIGRPTTPYQRGVFGTSGRAQAWDGAIRQGLQRAALGYGFGTEEKVFVDRYYVFEGARPENSFIGIFLQLGFLGLIFFIWLVAWPCVRVVRAVVRHETISGVGVAAAGIVVAGLAVAVVQSYVYSIGNVGSLTLWVGVFMLAVPTGTARPTAGPRPGLRSFRPGLQRRVVAACALAVLIVIAVPVGRWEAAGAATSMQAGIDQVRAAVGPGLAGPSLVGLAYVSNLNCFLYTSDGAAAALELCYDRSGRLIRAVDARGATTRQWTFQGWEGRASVRVDPATVTERIELLVRRREVGDAIGLLRLRIANCRDVSGRIPDRFVVDPTVLGATVKFCGSAARLVETVYGPTAGLSPATRHLVAGAARQISEVAAALRQDRRAGSTAVALVPRLVGAVRRLDSTAAVIDGDVRAMFRSLGIVA